MGSIFVFLYKVYKDFILNVSDLWKKYNNYFDGLINTLLRFEEALHFALTINNEFVLLSFLSLELILFAILKITNNFYLQFKNRLNLNYNNYLPLLKLIEPNTNNKIRNEWRFLFLYIYTVFTNICISCYHDNTQSMLYISY